MILRTQIFVLYFAESRLFTSIYEAERLTKMSSSSLTGISLNVLSQLNIQLEFIMKTFITAIALSVASLTALVSFSSNAASVSFPDSLAVTGVNGETQFATHQIQLAEGENLIELKYHDIFEVNADDSGAWVKSGPLYLILESDLGQYQAMTPIIDTEEEAYDFINNPIITLKGAQGSKRNVALLTHHQLMAKLLLAKQ